MEPGEWVAATPRILLGRVFGLAYQGAQDPTRATIATLPVTDRTRGFGDCDDVSALVAACARAIGLTPFFRVAKTSVAHVSCVVRLPSGQMISIDPVGHPDHDFGWAMPAGDVQLFNLSGDPVTIPALGSIMNCPHCAIPTLLAGIDGRTPRRARRHWIATRYADRLGPRVLSIPLRHHQLFMRGLAVDGTPAVDEHGMGYTYDMGRDLWIEDGLRGDMEGLGKFGDGFKRFRKRTAGIRKLIRRVAKPLRKIQAKLLQSKVAQNIVGGALMSVGIPRAATKAVLEASGEILEKGGLPALVRMIRKDPQAALKMVSQAAKAGLKRATQLVGVDDPYGTGEEAPGYYIEQSGGSAYGQPVLQLVGVPYVASMGELDVTAIPKPGSWYRVRKGDSLLSITSKAYGVPTGPDRLKRAKWINNAAANRRGGKFDRNAKDNLFKDGKVSMSPKFSAQNQDAADGLPGKSYAVLWIPETQGDEPSLALPKTTPTTTPSTPKVVKPTPTTTPASGGKVGVWYQIKKGDTLLTVAGREYGVPSGSTRLDRARWINDAQANAFAFDPNAKDSLFPRGKISFSPRFGASKKEYAKIWLPASKGHEPSKTGDLPPVDPNPPKDPVEDKKEKFKKACLNTPNGHYVETKTGPGCMVCHPEKGEVWDERSQTCVTQTKPPVDPNKAKREACERAGGRWDNWIPECIIPVDPPKDPDKAKREACIASGGTWDAGRRQCMPKTQLPPKDPDRAKREACEASGGTWDPSRRTCLKVEIDPGPNTDPDIDPDPGPDQDKKGGGILPLAIMAAIAFMGSKK